MFKRLATEKNTFAEEDKDRHVYWENHHPSDFGDEDENPILDLDGYGGFGPDSIILKELTPGDYHIWIHVSDPEEYLGIVSAKVILYGTKASRTEQIFQKDFSQLKAGDAVYVTTLRVTDGGAKSLIQVPVD